MASAEYCICCGKEIPEGNQVCIMCGYKTKGKQKQIDRIRNMSVDELARFLYNDVGEDYSGLKYIGREDMFSEKNVREWLESEVEGE